MKSYMIKNHRKKIPYKKQRNLLLKKRKMMKNKFDVTKFPVYIIKNI